MSPLFGPSTPEATIKANHEVLVRRFGYIDKMLGAGPYLGGANFRVLARPAVQKALADESRLEDAQKLAAA